VSKRGSKPSNTLCFQEDDEKKYRCKKHSKDPIPDFDFDDGKLMYFMIQRKDTIGYIDFLRGKYPDDAVTVGSSDEKVIKGHLEEMTCDERRRLETQDFDSLWDNTWVNHSSLLFVKEYPEAKRKFWQLNVQNLIKNTDCKWSETEFGFPKGRRYLNESDLECATREFFEESGYDRSDRSIKIIDTDEPWIEIFTGTDNVRYKHVYYLAKIDEKASNPIYEKKNFHQSGEVSNCGWFTFKECLKRIRPYDTEKKNVLSRVNEHLIDETRSV
jgi:8-oxo-dGTP pyrophosphatase MutT (NUDIX family)